MKQLYNIEIKDTEHRSRLAIFLICFLSFCILNLESYAQETPRKKIGLVLSGGGAKGFAHVGVLKVLEKAGVKIDYIGGTSMGAVVGGLYASGYNAKQIDSIFHATNFEHLLQDYIPRASKNFFEKLNDEKYSFSLPFTGFKIKIPISLSKGLYNYNALNQLFKNQRNIRDFSKLPIPFLCIATDVETGREVLLNNGYLPQAILASSAFPSLFSPVEINGKVLIDGGVANNYPIEHVRAMGADIIIGVDVQDDLKKRKDLNEATRILVQITNLQMHENMIGKAAQTDIYIRPDVSEYGVMGFSNQDQIVKKGEDAAALQYEKIKALAIENFVTQNAKISTDSLQISSVSMNEINNYSRAYVVGKLGFSDNTKICYNDIKVGINKLNATQNFSVINYEILKNDQNENIFSLNLTENAVKTYVKFGLHYDGLYKTGVLANMTRKGNFFLNDVVSFDAILGDNFRYNFDYYIDNGFYWSFGFKSRFNGFNRNIATDFSNGRLLSQFGINSININFSDLTHQAFVQTVFRQKFQVGFGAEFKYLKIASETLQASKPVFENSDYWSAFGTIKYDSFDNKYFPTKGIYLSGDFQTYLLSSDYNGNFNPFSIAKAEVGFTKTFFKKISFKSISEAGLSIGARSVPYFNFVLGGYGFQTINNFKHFYGYDFLSLSGDSYIKTTATFDYEFINKNHINLSANYAYIQDRLFETTRWITTPRFSGYAIGYGIESIVGPIELKQTYSPETGKGFTFISVGFWF